MTRFYGLRGSKLRNFILGAVIGPAYISFGYNNACAGGLLDLEAWITIFPRIDTLNTTGARKQDNSRIQGACIT